MRKIGLERHYAEDDLVLMSQIAQGNADAFQTVLDAHMKPVFHFVFSILRDIGAAEDVTQETCVKLWNHAQSWAPEGKIRSWLFRIAHNLSIDEIRKRRPHVDIDSFAESTDSDGSLSSDEENPLEANKPQGGDGMKGAMMLPPRHPQQKQLRQHQPLQQMKKRYLISLIRMGMEPSVKMSSIQEFRH